MGTASDASGDKGANIALGASANASGEFGANIALGSNATASGDDGCNIAVGFFSSATGTNSVAIGTGAVATGSIAVGTQAYASNAARHMATSLKPNGSDRPALRPNARAEHSNATAIGNGATTSRDYEVHEFQHLPHGGHQLGAIEGRARRADGDHHH